MRITMPAPKRRKTEVIYQPPCHTCTGECCRHIALHIDTPTCKRDYDNLRWYLMHDRVKVGIDLDGAWLLEVATPCRYLQTDNRCAIYARRPRICRTYPGKDQTCEHDAGRSPYKVLFKTHQALERYLTRKGRQWKLQ
jgi:Fe-S-cluster containining protein